MSAELPQPNMHSAIAQHMAHPAGALGDPGTESLAEQMLPTQPAELWPAEEPPAEIDDLSLTWADAALFALGVMVGAIASWLWPLGFASGI